MRCRPIEYVKKNEELIPSCTNCRNKKCKYGYNGRRKLASITNNTVIACNDWRK